MTLPALALACGSPAPPPPPPPEPAWPETRVVARIHRPDREPPFRDPEYRFEVARLAVLDDALVLGVDRRDREPPADPCALGGGTEDTLLLRQLGEAELRVPGPHPVSATYAIGSHGTHAYDVAGTLTIDRVAESRLSGALALQGEPPNSVSGAFTAEVVRCPGRKLDWPGMGPSKVAYAFGKLEGRAVVGELGYAKLLAGVEGTSKGTADLLVLQVVPSTGCDPRAPGLHELDAIWFLSTLPPGTGPLPMEGIAKVWTYFPPNSASNNLGVRGTITVTERTAGRIRGRLDLQTDADGTLTGTLDAAIEDCSSWTGPYPM